MKNPYKHLSLPELHKTCKNTIALCREAKKNDNFSEIKHLRKEIGLIRQYIKIRYNEMPKAPVDPEYTKIQILKREQRFEKTSQLGFAISSHAYKRYKLRFDPNITLDELYEKVAKSDLMTYIRIFRNGQCQVCEDCVAVVTNKLIVTFKRGS